LLKRRKCSGRDLRGFLRKKAISASLLKKEKWGEKRILFRRGIYPERIIRKLKRGSSEGI